MDLSSDNKMSHGHASPAGKLYSEAENEVTYEGTSNLYLDPQKERKMMLKFDVSSADMKLKV